MLYIRDSLFGNPALQALSGTRVEPLGRSAKRQKRELTARELSDLRPATAGSNFLAIHISRCAQGHINAHKVRLLTSLPTPHDVSINDRNAHEIR